MSLRLYLVVFLFVNIFLGTPLCHAAPAASAASAAPAAPAVPAASPPATNDPAQLQRLQARVDELEKALQEMKASNALDHTK
jgi:hypothetical protein